MHIKKLIIRNYRSLKDVVINFNDNLNIIVGDNESGKSTLLEAINLALNGRINGRNANSELHPFLFNTRTVDEYIKNLRDGNSIEPPKISIELYLADDTALARLKGSINSLKEDSAGIKFVIEFDERHGSEYSSYIKNPNEIKTIPVEYYKITWCSFAGEYITARSIPIKSTLVDASTINHNAGAGRYLLDIMRDYLTPEQWAKLSVSYRKTQGFISGRRKCQKHKQ